MIFIQSDNRQSDGFRYLFCHLTGFIGVRGDVWVPKEGKGFWTSTSKTSGWATNFKLELIK